MFYSSLLLGFGQLSLESLLCWEKTVTCQYWNQPYDFWSLLNSTSHKYRGKKGMCAIMFWYKNKKLVDLQTFALFYISKGFTLFSRSALRQNNNTTVLCKSHNFITAGERATIHFRCLLAHIYIFMLTDTWNSAIWKNRNSTFRIKFGVHPEWHFKGAILKDGQDLLLFI